MNEPEAPIDTRNWDSIDIFLFSNGQQYSPPRKYHLRPAELKWWDGTIHYLAQCHYGSTCSKMELYTLDGKKIEGPLELKNDAAYVAVAPPDAFILAGYEKYLIKASRSREKRQEQLLISNAMLKPDENEASDKNMKSTQSNTHVDIVSTGKIQETVIENPNRETFNLNTEEQKNVDTSVPNKKTDDAYQKENASEGRNRKFKNNVRSQKINNNKISIKNRGSPFPQIEENAKMRKKKNDFKKDSEFVTRNNERRNLAEPYRKLDKVIDMCGTAPPGNKKFESKLHKDIEENAQSIFKEPAQKVTGSNDNLDKINFSFKNELATQESEITTNSMNRNIIQNSNSLTEKQTQEQATSFINNDKQININLNIKLKNYTMNDSKSDNFLIKYYSKSNICLVADKASQVNVDVSLSKKKINSEEDIIHINKTSKYNANYIEDNIFKFDKTKVIVVRCKCGNNIYAENIMRGEQCHSDKAIIFLLPTTDEKVLASNNYDENIQTSDTRIQKSGPDNIILESTNFTYDKADDKTRGSTLLRNKGVDYTNPETKKETENDRQISKSNPLVESQDLIAKSTQMDWCNILLQLKRHEDGHYTFHLPSLALLKQYNMNTVYYLFYLFYSQSKLKDISQGLNKLIYYLHNKYY